MQKMSKNKVILYCLLSFFISLVIRLVPILLSSEIKIIPDELGFLIYPATLAGRDWTAIKGDISYYGYGYSILFTPIFLITSNPYIIYYSIYAISEIVVALTAPIIFIISFKFFKIDNHNISLFLSVLFSLISITEQKYINNEPMISLICWLVVLILCLLVNNRDNKKKRVVLTVLLMLISAYSLTVHNRLYVLLFSLILTFIIYGFVHKKIPASPLTVVILGGASILLVPKLSKYMAKQFVAVKTTTDSKEQLLNSIDSTTSRMSNSLLKLFDFDYWGSFFRTVIGNVYTGVFFTGGLFVITLVVFLIMLKKWISLMVLKNGAEAGTEENNNIVVEVILLFGVICFFVTVAGLGLEWLELAKKGIDKGYYYDTTATKCFSYIRYYSVYLSIACISGFAYFYKNDFGISRIMKSVMLFFLIVIGWMKMIVPYWGKSANGVSVFGCYGLYPADKTQTTVYLYIWTTFLCVAISLLTIFLIKGKNSKKIIAALIIVFLFVYFRTVYNSAALDVTYENRADGGYKFIKELEEKADLPEKIHVYTPYQPTYLYAYSFMLNDYVIESAENFPLELEEGIVVTNRFYTKYYGSGFDCYQMDDNEYVWIKGDEISQKITDQLKIILQ